MRWCIVELLFLALLGAFVVSATTDSARAQENEASGKSHAADDSQDESNAESGSAESSAPHAEEETDAHGEGAGHGAGGGHDSTDLSHLNAREGLEDPKELRSDLAVWTLVVFLLLLALLSKFAWGPVVEGLDKREQAISDQIDEAKASAEKAAVQLQQYEQKLAAAGEEAKEILSQARRDGEVSRERIVAEAREAADRERRRAVDDISSARNAALDQITQRSVDLAVSMAGRLIQRELDAQDHSKLVQEALDQLPSQN